jgi:hypothetical protein
MSFEIHQPRGRDHRRSVTGKARIRRDGCITFASSDLDSVRINGRAVVLVDPLNKRIGFRSPRDGEEDVAYVVKPNDGSSTSRRISCISVLKDLSALPSLSLVVDLHVDKKQELIHFSV